VLVPSPVAEDATASAAGSLARKVFDGVKTDHPAAAWDPAGWANHVARVLALVEASGHHVTFREVLALAAAVGIELRDNDVEARERRAFGSLFGAPGSRSATVPSLTALRRTLVRLDPARAAHPELDAGFSQGDRRDGAVRERWARALTGPPGAHPTAAFLGLCVDGNAPAKGTVCAALSALGSGRFNGKAEPGLLPLTSSVHPGTVRGGTQALRGVIDLTRAVVEPASEGVGAYIEPGLRCPALVVAPPGADRRKAPRLRLDLELYEMMGRAASGAGVDREALGPRVAQVDAWFDALSASWDGVLQHRPVEGMVTFQTLLGEAGQAPIALRPSARGKSVAVASAPEVGAPPLSALQALELAHLSKVLVTPAACASALLRWAGFSPEPHAKVRAASPVERDAGGAPRVARVGKRSDLKSPMFPWSTHTLALALKPDGTVDTKDWDALASVLGAALARSLGLDDAKVDGRGALRAAWKADEVHFDLNLSGRLVHQWLGQGIDGLQLEQVEGGPLERDGLTLRPRVVCDLLAGDVPFPHTHRWWLLGTWAAWALLLDAMGEARGVPKPLVLPRAPESDVGAGLRAYERVRDGWWKGEESRESVVWAGQAAGFLQPTQAHKHVELLMEGPLLDVVQLVARKVDRDVEGRPERRTVRALEQGLLDAGLYLQPPGETVRGRLPKGSLEQDAPASAAFGGLLRSTLQRLGMLDAASDGATLFRAPWGGEDGR
jgi:hypothetical protein